MYYSESCVPVLTCQATVGVDGNTECAMTGSFCFWKVVDSTCSAGTGNIYGCTGTSGGMTYIQCIKISYN